MRIEDQGFAGYYDATIAPDASVGMGDFAEWLGFGPPPPRPEVPGSFVVEPDPPVAPPPAVPGGGGGLAMPARRAVVTTNDPAPDGDLRIRSGPGTSYDQIGGAEKGGTVGILGFSDDGAWANVVWPGGLRLSAASGWVAARFLVEIPASVDPVVPPHPGGLTPVVNKDDGGISTPLMVLAGVAIVGLGVYLLGGK